jgi:hypothetical protein
MANLAAKKARKKLNQNRLKRKNNFLFHNSKRPFSLQGKAFLFWAFKIPQFVFALGMEALSELFLHDISIEAKLQMQKSDCREPDPPLCKSKRKLKMRGTP